MKKQIRYSPEVREQAVRLLYEHQGDYGPVGKLKRAKKNKKLATTHQEIAELTENSISGSLSCRQFC